MEDFIYVPRAIVFLSSEPFFTAFSRLLTFYHGYVIFPEQCGLTNVSTSELQPLIQKVHNHIKKNKLINDKLLLTREEISDEIKILCYSDQHFKNFIKNTSLYIQNFKEFLISFLLTYKFKDNSHKSWSALS